MKTSFQLIEVPCAAGLLALVALWFPAAQIHAADENNVGQSQPALTSEEAFGKLLFERETFGGNGRTCATCHTGPGFTINPQDVQARFAANPNDSLIDSDDGVGNSFMRLLTHATIRLKIPLPPNIELEENPAAAFVEVFRGNPTPINIALEHCNSLDVDCLEDHPVLMHDGRFHTLEEQAQRAVEAHTEHTEEPAFDELRAMARFQATLFSSPALEAFAAGGPAPELPHPDTLTQSQHRGLVLFKSSNFCGGCHTGPMLNQRISGRRFESVRVSELNEIGNPLHTFLVTNPDGSVTRVVSPDPGRLLITGGQVDANAPGQVKDINFFKIPTLWGIKHTAPYFHDNSAKTLENVLRHYDKFFRIRDQLKGFKNTKGLTAQEQADIIEFLKLL